MRGIEFGPPGPKSGILGKKGPKLEGLTASSLQRFEWFQKYDAHGLGSEDSGRVQLLSSKEQTAVARIGVGGQNLGPRAKIWEFGQKSKIFPKLSFARCIKVFLKIQKNTPYTFLV